MTTTIKLTQKALVFMTSTVGAMALMSCATIAQTTSMSDTSTTAMAAAETMEASLYDRLGGYNGISAVVDEFADRLFHDPRISQFFAGMGDDTRNSFKQKNKNLVCNVTGGPCKNIARAPAVVHNGLGITTGDFNIVAGHLVDVLNEFNVPEQEHNELMAIIGSLQPIIVDRPDVMVTSQEQPATR